MMSERTENRETRPHAEQLCFRCYGSRAHDKRRSASRPQHHILNMSHILFSCLHCIHVFIYSWIDVWTRPSELRPTCRRLPSPSSWLSGMRPQHLRDFYFFTWDPKQLPAPCWDPDRLTDHRLTDHRSQTNWSPITMICRCVCVCVRQSIVLFA